MRAHDRSQKLVALNIFPNASCPSSNGGAIVYIENRLLLCMPIVAYYEA